MKAILFPLFTLFLFLETSLASYTHQDLMKSLKESEVNSISLIDNKEAVRDTVNLFLKVFKVYSKELFKLETENLYAKDAFLNDRIQSIKGASKIKRYFLNTFIKLKKAKFNILDVVYGDRDAYVRWEMVLYTKGGNKPLKNLGMSQLRFNTEGKIIYHQDHWDYSEILQQMPLIRHLMNAMKDNT
ncbi:MAG: hypothetical protein CME68_10990 [Halobacteriovoraceae bacterium]|nr:hypothetical protein [Halobacteriovoraceae bacterium]